MFFALGAHLPYWPVWLEAWGLDEAGIATYLGAALLARIVGTVVLPAIADRHAIRRRMITWTALATVAAHLAHLAADTPGTLMAVTLVAAVVMAPSVPMGEALGLRAAQSHGFAYAHVRAIGSLGFIAANAGIGVLIGALGPDAVLWAVVIGFAAVAVLGAVHPGGGAAPGAGTDRAGYGEVMRVFTIPAFLVFAAASTAGQASHMVYYTYSVLDWRAQGIGDAVIGWLWAFGVIAETVLMLGPGRAWVARTGPALALGLAALAGLVRWLAMAAEPDPLLLWPLQALHALSFGLGHLAIMAFLAAALPGRMLGAAQGLKAGIIGGGTNALVLLAAGGLAAAHGVAAGYLLAAALSAVAVGLALVLWQVWDGAPLVRE